MKRNAVGLNESLVIGRDYNYKYRTGKGMVNSWEWNVFVEDFMGRPASNAVPGFATVIDTGATLVAGTDKGGSVLIQSDGATEGVTNYLARGIVLDSTPFYMEARVKTEDADDTDLIIGLSDLGTITDPEDFFDGTQDNFVGFGVIDGSAALKLTYDGGNAGATTDTASASLVDGTWATIAIDYNGGYLRGWLDGNLVVTMSAPAKLPQGALAPFFSFRTGSDAGHDGWFEFFRVAQAIVR